MTTHGDTLGMVEINGGLGSATNNQDPISTGAAKLYCEFAKGALGALHFYPSSCPTRTRGVVIPPSIPQDIVMYIPESIGKCIFWQIVSLHLLRYKWPQQ